MLTPPFDESFHGVNGPIDVSLVDRIILLTVPVAHPVAMGTCVCEVIFIDPSGWRLLARVVEPVL